MRLEFGTLIRRLSPLLLVVAALLPAIASAQGPLPRAVIPTRDASAQPGVVDAGPLAASQRLSLTLTLAPSADRVAALDTYLAQQQSAVSEHYHQWLTPAQFAASYGASAADTAHLITYLEAKGLGVDSVSASGMRLEVSGFTAQVEAAFAVSLRSLQVEGGVYFGSAGKASLPESVGALVAGIDGLDNLPQAVSGTALRAHAASGDALSLASVAAQVDANASGLLVLDASGSVGNFSGSQLAGLNAVFRQAAVQGITTLIVSDGSAAGMPVAFPDVVLLSRADTAAWQGLTFAARPAWQHAPGLPGDGLREQPDATVTSIPAFTQMLATLALQTGGRLGNIAPTLYQLAPVAGIFSQTDGAHSWQPATGLGLLNILKFAQAYPRGVGTSTLSVTSSSTAPTHGQSFFLTVTAATTNGGGIPTGTITFSSPQVAFTSSSVALNSNGIAQSNSYTLPGGTYNITASYSGDASYAPTTATITVTVQPEAAIFTISAPTSVTLGSTITATVTLTSASGVGTPSGSVTVTPSGITGALAVTQTVAGSNGTASANFTFTSKQAGSVSLQASCTSNDASFSCFTPQTSTTIVPQATPTVTLAVTPMSPTAGTPVTLTGSVTGVSGIGPTGSVQFFDGNISLGFGGAPSASFSGNLSSGTSHMLTAVYQGDSNYLKATSNTVNTSVATAVTTTTVNASATSASFGQSVSLNVTVSSKTVVNGTQPTGTLTFTGAGGVTSSPVSGGSANVTLNNLAVGTYTIGTTYSGDTNYSASTGNTVVLTVTQATASLNTSISSTSFSTGSTSTLTVTVTLPGNGLLPTGSTFLATIVGVTGATYPGIFMTNTGGNTGTGSVTIPAPLAGVYTLQVTCATNLNYTCAPSTLSITSTATTTVTPPATGTTPSMTALAITPTLPAAGQTITLTATVSAAAAAVAANPLAGTVNFYDGTTLLGSGTIVDVGLNGVATTTATLTGTTAAHSLTATYAGNTVYAASTSAALPLTLSAAAAVITLSSNVSAAGGIAGGSVVLTATVTGSSTTGSAPTGTVSFYIAGANPALIGMASLGAAGNGIALAIFSTPNLPSGTTTIYATYNGDANFSSTSSNSITIGLSDYVVNFIPQTLTIGRGQSGTTTAVITLINGFAGSVVLGCSPAPNLLMSCSFNPQVITGGGTSTLSVTTTAPKTAALRQPNPISLGAASGASLAVLLCWLLPVRRRRVPRVLMVFAAVALSLNLGCGGNDFVSPQAVTNAGTPLGTTLLTISTAGTNGSSTVRHNYTFQVTVQ